MDPTAPPEIVQVSSEQASAAPTSSDPSAVRAAGRRVAQAGLAVVAVIVVGCFGVLITAARAASTAAH